MDDPASTVTWQQTGLASVKALRTCFAIGGMTGNLGVRASVESQAYEGLTWPLLTGELIGWVSFGTTARSVEAWGSILGPVADMVLEWVTSGAASVSLNTSVAGRASPGSRDRGKLSVSYHNQEKMLVVAYFTGRFDRLPGASAIFTADSAEKPGFVGTADSFKAFNGFWWIFV